MDNTYYPIPKQLCKSCVDGYIHIDKQHQSPTIEKSCHGIENNILIFIDPALVERFGIEDGTQFKQIPTEQGILLRRMS
jgi:hypothetical protein